MAVDPQKILQVVASLQPQIQTAQMLVGLGITTVQKVKEFFASQGHDDEVLAGILAEVDARIARRA